MSTLIQRNFSGGEISPALYSRVDLTKYSTGLRTLRNAMTLSDGGVTNRPGTEYVATAKGPCRLIKWRQSDSSSYVLELGANYMRFISSTGQVNVSSVTAWSGATAYVAGSLASRAGVNYYCILAHTNQQPPNATYWYALTGTIMEIPTPWSYAEVLRLQFVQSKGSMLLVHGSHHPRELTSTAATTWVLAFTTNNGASYFLPSYIAAPTSLTNDGSAGTNYWYYVTTVLENGEESYLSASTSTDSGVGPGIRTLTWVAAASAFGYNVYRLDGAGLGFIGFTTSVSFLDFGTSIDPARVPPVVRTEFVSAPSGGNHPAAVSQSRQRLIVGCLGSLFPEDVWASRIGAPRNFQKQYPIAADGSLRFPVRGKEVNEVRHIVDSGSVFVFTSEGEVALGGDLNGNLTPTDVNPTFVSYNGASYVPPITIGSNIIYVQAQGSIVRDLGFDIASGGKNGQRDGNISATAKHLVRGKTITDWAYQKTPDSIVLAVLDEGSLAGITYVREQEIIAWHRHDTDGDFESTCSIQESTEHAVYFSVERTISGSAVRYIEKLHTRQIDDIVDAVFVDSSLTYDGRNVGATTMTLSGSGWTSDDTLTLTASASFFVAGDVGNEIWLTGADDIVYRCSITAYTSATVVSVKPDKTVTVASSLRATATTNWAKAVDEVSGLAHLQGKQVSVLGNGYVVANPNNESYGTPLTVASGAITLPACYSVIHVGLPYISDVQTLDIDTVNGETIVDKKKLVNKVTMHVQDTRGLWAGAGPPTDDDTDPLEELNELKIRESEDWATPNNLVTDVVDITLKSHWNSSGRVFIRQIDPLPMTILSIAPAGLFPFRREK